MTKGAGDMGFSLRPLRIPSGWTVRHNNFVDAPLENSYWDYDGVLLLAYHAEWDLLIDLAWRAGLASDPRAKRGVFLLQVMNGDRSGRVLSRFESGDPAAVAVELDRLFADMSARYAPNLRYADYSSEEVDMLMQLYKTMLKLRSEDPAFDARVQISDVWVEDKLMAVAPMAQRYWQGLDPETREGAFRIETHLCPHVLRLCDWSHPRRENENDLAARLDAHFRSREA